jgi:segregation and condensation protein A
MISAPKQNQPTKLPEEIKLPKDLYIPPEALKVFLDTFEGPLDLLLYLIKKQNIDICDIPIAKITEQYMEYIELMQKLNWELASEYLVMAALLAEIKSKTLLPKPKQLEDEVLEEDPRTELIQRLQEYEQLKKATQYLDKLPRVNRDIFPITLPKPQNIAEKKYSPVALEELISSLVNLLKKNENRKAHSIEKETLSVHDKILFLEQNLKRDHWIYFHKLLKVEENTEGVVVTLMAILELLRQQLIEIEITKNQLFQCRYIKT